MRLTHTALLSLAVAPLTHAAISLDATNTTWAGSTLVTLYDTVGNTKVYLGNELGANYDPSYHGAAVTISSGSMFLTAMQATPFTSGTLGLTPELAGSNLAAGTTVHLSYTGLTSTPSYVALVGGNISGYSYNAASGTLSITATTGTLAQTSANYGPGSTSQALAVIIETNPTYDFGGSVFRTDAHWGDLTNMVASYLGTSPLVGLNVTGLNGSPVTFDAYLSLAYLASIGINSGAEAQAYVQKANTEFPIGTTTTLFTAAGYDPQQAGVLYDIFGGQSSFDFNGGGLDDLIKATYVNNSWSAGNIGLIAVPEPSTYGLALGGLALVAVAVRRRNKTKV